MTSGEFNFRGQTIDTEEKVSMLVGELCRERAALNPGPEGYVSCFWLGIHMALSQPEYAAALQNLFDPDGQLKDQVDGIVAELVQRFPGEGIGTEV